MVLIYKGQAVVFVFRCQQIVYYNINAPKAEQTFSPMKYITYKSPKQVV